MPVRVGPTTRSWLLPERRRRSGKTSRATSRTISSTSTRLSVTVADLRAGSLSGDTGGIDGRSQYEHGIENAASRSTHRGAHCDRGSRPLFLGARWDGIILA